MCSLLLAGCRDHAMWSTREAHAATAPTRTPAASAAQQPTTAPPATVPTPVTPPTQSASAVRGVLLITIDSLRADMPWNGYARPIAPNLTRFADTAVVYSHAYALSSYTSMSVAGMLASRLPSELQRDGEFFNRYPRSNTFFPELLQQAGVRTVSAQTHFYFRPGYAGFEQGFDVWEMLPGIHVDFTTDLDITGDRHEAMAERLLSDARNTQGRFFAWFHFMDPHDRYLPHRGIGPYGRTLRDLYDAEVTFADQQVGRLLDFVGRQPWGQNVAIIISADHGEAFGEHRMNRHAFELWQPLVRVPLMIRLPGTVHRVIDTNRSHADLAPTILSLLGERVPTDMRGVSLVDELRGGAPAERDVWADLPETTVSHRRRALISGRHKLIAFERDTHVDVFDVESDAAEATPLRNSNRAAHDAMVARYRAGVANIREVAPYGSRMRERQQH